MGIEFLSGGLFTAVQDKGRFGYQQYGVSVAGAADLRSFILANHLVANDENEAVLEINLLGPSVIIEEPATIAITGGNLAPAVNGAPAAMYRAIRTPAGALLSFGAPVTGCRAYVAFAGGLDINPVMGSRSTFVKGSLGGYQGRKLEKGDRINLRDPYAYIPGLEERAVAPDDFSGGEFTARVVMGPQDDGFTEAGIATFLGSAYTVTNEFDRMGCRLAGEAIEHKAGGDIISDAIAFGAIQVPSKGEPILMLADRQTTGGYTKIATVITADFSVAAQLTPGKRIRFKKVDIAEAQDLYAAWLNGLRAARAELDAGAAAWQARAQPARSFKIAVNGVVYDVTAQEIT